MSSLRTRLHPGRAQRRLRVLQFIASGLLGTNAFADGWSAGALGAVCHYFILTVATSFYLVASRHITALVRHPFLSGPLYGVVIFLVMNFIVVPLSAVPVTKHSSDDVYGDLWSRLYFVGLHSALIVRRHCLARAA